MGSTWNSKVQTKHGHGRKYSRGYKPTSEPVYYKANPIVKPIFKKWIDSGRTLKQLAEFVAISLPTLQNWNRGAYSSFAKVAILLDAFNMKIVVVPLSKQVANGKDAIIHVVKEPHDVTQAASHRFSNDNPGEDRVCLKCEGTFVSYGNRICKSCTEENKRVG